MDDLYIVTVHYVIDSLAQTFMPEEKYHPKMSVAEILTVAIAAARYCGNNLEQALLLMRQIGYIPRGRCLSVSRFNRQLHKHEAFLELCVETLLELARTGDTYIIDSMPVPVCKRVRARRCRKVRGADFCGYCVAKKEKFFGWRLHLICTPDGRPANFTLLPASYHDLTPSSRSPTIFLKVRVSSQIRATIMRTAKPFWRLRVFASSPFARSTCNRTPGGMNGRSKPIAPPSKPETVNWKAWDLNGSRLVPTRAFPSKSMLRSLLSGSLNRLQISNQGPMSMFRW